jgi:hypothetical protein
MQQQPQWARYAVADADAATIVGYAAAATISAVHVPTASYFLPNAPHCPFWSSYRKQPRPVVAANRVPERL